MDDKTINISAKGSAESRFTHASFKASVTKQASAGPTAKENARTAIDQILHAINKHADTAQIDVARLKTTFSVDVTRDRGTGNFSGYQAVYTVAFRADNLAEAARVHDALTSIPGVESPTPVFHQDKGPEVHAKAFDVAYKAAQVRFEAEAYICGLNPSAYRIVSWRVDDEERYSGGGKFMAVRSAGGEVDIEPGRAVYELTLHVEYARVIV